MRRPGVRIPSRPPSFNDLERPNSSYRGTLGLSSLPDSFRFLVIHPERHCLCAASSVNTSRTYRELVALETSSTIVRSSSLGVRFLCRHAAGCRTYHAFHKQMVTASSLKFGSTRDLPSFLPRSQRKLLEQLMGSS